MKQKDLNAQKTKSIKDLKKELSNFNAHLAEKKLEIKMGKIKNVHAVADVKRSIAQIKTLITIKEIDDKKTAEGAKDGTK